MIKVAVLPALGIGDALLMMIASHQFKLKGYDVTTFHNALPELSSWFPAHNLAPLPILEELLEALTSFHLILVQNDNSSKITRFIQTFRSRLSIFYPTYCATKHPPLFPQDRVFDRNRPMAENIACAVASLLALAIPSKVNGLTPPHQGLIHRVKKERVVLHPMSRESVKNWKQTGFMTLARHLKNRDFHPVFCVGPQERNDWKFVEAQGFDLPEFDTLSQLASFIYESGYVIGNDSSIGHLASNLQIPTIIIANDEKRMRLWRPGWLLGQLVLPPPFLPNWKFLRLREKQWQHFVSPSQVLRSFNQLVRVF